MTVKKIHIGYGPLPKQQEAHALSYKYRAFCGGWGNGKTSWGCAEMFMLLHEFPGTNALMLRSTRPELRSTSWDMFLNGDGSDEPTRWPGIPRETLAKNNISDLYLEFRNGSKVWGLPCDDPKKLENYNLGLFWMDQAEEVPQEYALKLQGRLRQKSGPRMGLYTMNPDGHNWLWKRFIDPDRPAVWKELYGIVEATPMDNPFLPEDYIAQFASLPEHWQQRYVLGSHDVFAGQIFTDWNEDIHIIEDFLIPSHWERWCCMDPGIRHEGCLTWCARDPLGNVYYYRELLQSGQTVGWWANQVDRIEQEADIGGPYETITRRLIGPESQQRAQTDGKSVYDLFQEFGVFFDLADRDPIARIHTISDHLRPKTGHLHPITRDDPGPRLYVFRSCRKLQEYLPQYRWKPQRPSISDEDELEKPRKKDDHNIDNLGHILLDMAQQPAYADNLERHNPVELLDQHFLAAVEAARTPYGTSSSDDGIWPTEYELSGIFPSDDWDYYDE